MKRALPVGRPAIFRFRLFFRRRLLLQVGAAKKIAIYVDGQPLGPSLSLLADPCGLTIGYYAEQQTSLDGYFDEVRLLPSE